MTVLSATSRERGRFAGEHHEEWGTIDESLSFRHTPIAMFDLPRLIRGQFDGATIDAIRLAFNQNQPPGNARF